MTYFKEWLSKEDFNEWLSKEKQLILDRELIKAIRENDLTEIENLIKKGANVNTKHFEGLKDCESTTALRIAILKSHIGIVKILIMYGADVNEADETGRTILIDAVFIKNFFAKYLSEKVAYTIKIKLLLENGADVNAKDIWGNTALSIAINNEDYGTVDLLKQYGATE